MAVLSTTTKGQLGWKAAKTAAQNPGVTRFAAKVGAKSAPPIAKLSFKVGKPVAKRKARHRLEQIGETLAEIGEAIFAIGEVVGATMAAYGPLAAQQLGWAEPPKEKRTAPRVAAGAVIGAGAVYFFDPKSGAERREQVLQLINGGPEPTSTPAQTT